MKYIIRFIAAIPMLSIGLSMLFALVYAFEYPLFALLAIGNFWAFVWISHYYECIVDETCDFIKEMCNKTPVYK